MEDMAIAAWSVNQKTAFDGQPGPGDKHFAFPVSCLHLHQPACVLVDECALTRNVQGRGPALWQIAWHAEWRACDIVPVQRGDIIPGDSSLQ